MILSKTPFRISFVGGSTDLSSFYKEHEYGCVISAAIDRYVYVAANRRFDDKIRLAYSTNELVSTLEEIKNERIRESMRQLGIHKNIEIFYMSDMPTKMGLGGSSAFTVGLLNSLHRFTGVTAYPERLAREACNIEIDVLKNAIGKQDQYASSLGGFNYLRFNADGTVVSQPLLIDERLIRSIMENLFFVYLGIEHSASDILSNVTSQMTNTKSYLLRMRDLTDELHAELLKGNIDQFPLALNENWELKKQTSSLISSTGIDGVYAKCIDAGATAGKILGAGGGGFLMMYVPKDNQEQFMLKMNHMQIFQFNIDHNGSKIIHDDTDYGL